MSILLALALLTADPRMAAEHQARSMLERQAFRTLYACPSTGRHVGACPGWAVDHVVPLACGGIDAPGNMQWLPLAIKSCAGTVCKDRWERKVYCK